MARKVKEVMTENPVTVEAGAMVTDAARVMRDEDIGDVIVADHGNLVGIVTDRDIVVRCVAADLSPDSTAVREICSTDLATVGPDSDVSDAITLIRERAVKRVIVTEDSRAVGVVTIGDLAEELDPGSALADVARAEPNR
jgi:signal-transduction protein with cAMP-binding, CBS, and nucleotidyltransferase domain